MSLETKFIIAGKVLLGGGCGYIIALVIGKILTG